MTSQDQFFETLQKIPLGKKALEETKRLGFSVSFEKGFEHAGACDASSKKIILNDGLKMADLLPTFVHEARHAVQSESLTVQDEKTCCADMIKAYRAMEADAVANEVAFVHQAKELGVNVNLSQLTEKPYQSYKFGLKNGENNALNQAFQSWYSDNETLNLYDDFYAEQISFMAQKETKSGTKNAFAEKIPDKDILKVAPYLEVSFLKSPEAFSLRSTAKDVIDDAMQKYAKKTKSVQDKSVLTMYSRSKNGKITDDRELPPTVLLKQKIGQSR